MDEPILDMDAAEVIAYLEARYKKLMAEYHELVYAYWEEYLWGDWAMSHLEQRDA
jgi:hypothetical protein